MVCRRNCSLSSVAKQLLELRKDQFDGDVSGTPDRVGSAADNEPEFPLTHDSETSNRVATSRVPPPLPQAGNTSRRNSFESITSISLLMLKQPRCTPRNGWPP